MSEVKGARRRVCVRVRSGKSARARARAYRESESVGFEAGGRRTARGAAQP
ncbi:MAG TPA: hypothetical protein VGO96_03510 [Pyrinomonadaceae bacterium]|nr:hypothetical protein [Pyrinomonadaceae bacterium]